MRGPVAILCALGALSCQRNQIRAVLPPDARIDVFPQVSRAQLDAVLCQYSAYAVTRPRGGSS